MRAWLAVVVVVVLAALAVPARADTVTVGLFAWCRRRRFRRRPRGWNWRRRSATRSEARSAAPAFGKAPARAGDFQAAVKKGDVTIALVDAAYLASAGGNFTVASRRGDARRRVGARLATLVAHSADKIASLKGKHVLVPSIGGREADFLLNVLLGGEVGKDYFGKLEAAPDTASALAALGLGKADAAVVPASVDLPAGVVTVLKLPALSGPVLVTYGAVTAAQRATLRAQAALAFHGDATVGGFKAVATSNRSTPSRAGFSVPVSGGRSRCESRGAARGRRFGGRAGRSRGIERSPVTAFAIAPTPDTKK